VLIPAGEHKPGMQQVTAAWSAVRPAHAAEDIYRNIASAIFYPLDSAQPDGAAWPGRDFVLAAILMLLAAAPVFGASRHLNVR
jgi:hypothetical protein